jgi:hypothetical protein
MVLCSFVLGQPVATLPDPAGPQEIGLGSNSTPKVPTKPRSSGRLTRAFDFDSPTPNPVPEYWSRAQDESAIGGSFARPGFPSINLAELDRSVGFSGTTSVRLPTRGGSTSLVLQSGVIPVFADADYRVTAVVRTSGLRNARAAIVARFLDSASAPIPGAERRSDLMIADGRWSEIAVELPGQWPGSSYLQIELQTLQPREFIVGVGDRFRTVPEDFEGAAWFDDVRVTQLARLELSLNHPTGLVVSPERPSIRGVIRDLTGESLSTRIEIRDVKGEVVHTGGQPLNAGQDEVRFSPELPGFGWYRAMLEVVSSGRVVGVVTRDFVWLPADESPDPRAGGSADRRRLGLVLGDFASERSPHILRLAEELGARSITLPVWTADLTPAIAAERSKAMSPFVDGLLASWFDVGFALSEPPAGAVPPELLDRNDTWEVLAQDRRVWWPYLDQYLDRFGQRVRRWQIGPTGSASASWRRNIRSDLDRLDRLISTLVAGPVLTIPSRAEFGLSPEMIAGDQHTAAVSSLVSADMPSSAAGDLVRHWRAGGSAGGSADLTAVFELADEGTLDLSSAVDDMVRKVVEFWNAAGSGPAKMEARAALQQPWGWTDAKSPKPQIRPEFAAWRNLTRILADRVVVGTMPVAPGVKCYILAPDIGAPDDRGGALVLWNETALPEDAVLEAHLGSGAIWLVDRFGNKGMLQAPRHATDHIGDETIIANEQKARDEVVTAGLIRVRATTTPVFIEGIDVNLVRMLASMRITPAFLESSSQRKDLAIEFDNPWPMPISGQITIVEPVGTGVASDGLDRSWKIVPRVMRFASEAGSKISLPISVAFGGLEEAGRRDFVMLLDVTAERRLTGVRARTPVEIGLRNVRLDVQAMRGGPSGDDVIVEARVTNVGESPIDMELTAFPPGQPRTGSTIGGLLPGHQALRRFVFRGQAAAMAGQRVVLSLTEPGGGMRLNTSTVVP